MRRLLPSGIAGAAAVAALLVATASGTALAYFTTSGSGHSEASVSQLSAPTISLATPAIGGTVALVWVAVTPPGKGTVTYSVSRDGKPAEGNCPSASSPAPVTLCTDSDVPPGLHTYAVTAKWRSWSSGGPPTDAKVSIGSVTHFGLKAASSAPTAGSTDNLTITAQDENDATVTTYTGSHNLVFSGASASPGGTAPTVSNSSGSAKAFGATTAIEFKSGVAGVSGTKNGVMKLYRKGATTVEVSDGSVSSSPGLDLAVASAAASKITLGVESAAQSAGEANDLTVTVADTYGNPVDSYDGERDLTFSGAAASGGGNAPTVSDRSGAAVPFGSATEIEFDEGVASAAAGANGTMRLYKSGSSNLKVSNGSLTSSAVTVSVTAEEAGRFSLAASTTTPTAGGSSNLTTTALDPYGNTATGYTGSHNLTFSGASASPNATVPTVVGSGSTTAIPFGTTTAIEFKSGVAGVSSSKNGLMRLYRSGATSISVSDGAISTATPLAVTVSTASASRLAFANVALSAGSLGSGCLFACAVTGLGNNGTVKANVLVTDTYGNTISSIGSGKAVKITSTGGTIAGTPLSINSSGAAETATQFTYTAPANGNFSHTITAATSAGTTYTSATLTASR